MGVCVHVLPLAEGSDSDAQHLLPLLAVVLALQLWEMLSLGYRGPWLSRVSQAKLNKFNTWPICSSKAK